MSERRAAGERRRRRKNADGDSPIARQDNQAPFRQPRLRMPPVKFISDDEVEAIHDASLTILEEIGVDFIHPDAKTILKQAGADLDPNSDRVRFDRALITQAMATAPEQVTLHVLVEDLQRGKIRICRIDRPVAHSGRVVGGVGMANAVWSTDEALEHIAKAS